MEIVIDKDKVFLEVAKSTAYVGAATGEMERVATVDENEEMLLSFLESAYNELLCILAAYDAQIKDGTVLTMEVPGNFDMAKKGVVERLVFEFVVSTVIWKWLYLVMPEKAVMWEQKTEDLKKRIAGNMNARTGYIRRKQSPF